MTALTGNSCVYIVPQPGKLCGAGDLVGILRAAVAFCGLHGRLAVPPLRSGSDGEGVDASGDFLCICTVLTVAHARPAGIANNDCQHIARSDLNLSCALAASQTLVGNIIFALIGADHEISICCRSRDCHRIAASVKRQRVSHFIGLEFLVQRAAGDNQRGKRLGRVAEIAAHIRSTIHAIHHMEFVAIDDPSTCSIGVQARRREPAVQRAHPAVILSFRAVTAGKAVDRCDIGCVLINRFVFAIQHGITLICLLDRFGNQRDPVVTGFHLDIRIDQLAGPRAGSDRAEILALLSRHILDDHADRAETVVFRLCCQCACGQKPQQHDEGQKQCYHSFTHVRSIPPES